MSHLIFDADDTLWENNTVFEAIIGDFIDWLEHPDLGPEGIRRILDDIERVNTAAQGYGTRVFTQSLHQTVIHLRGRELEDADREHIAGLVRRLERDELELIDGVPETLRELATRHDLLLLTKGDDAEQQLKIDVSGLASHFRETRVVHEKDAGAYRALIRELDLPPSDTWMIGNSPRSDILPALEAGLRAVWIPHPATWTLEDDELPDDDDRIVTVERFRDLAERF